MAPWTMDDWAYVERRSVTDPKGRSWTVAVMDMLGQHGDPAIPSQVAEMQYASGRYFALIYSASGSIQWESGHRTLGEATEAFERLLASVIDGSLDPSQPVFRADLED